MKLYGYWRSSCTYRVRIALALKGLAYEVLPVNLLEAEQRADGFVAMNPIGQVPVLELPDGSRLTQSIAILEYLEETHPEPALLPREPLSRARVRQLTELVSSGIQPLQNFSVMQRLKNEHGVDAKAWSAFHIRRGLLAYQQLAESTAGELSVGDSPTFADCALIPQLYNARRFGIDVEGELPLLARIDARAAAMEAFRAAHPDRQPDAPQDG
jgi:maleylpyruvate isomerase